jgi:hypothetical protein
MSPKYRGLRKPSSARPKRVAHEHICDTKMASYCAPRVHISSRGKREVWQLVFLLRC